MFRGLYDWTMRLANHRHALRSLALVSFAESSFFPIPPDVLLIPMILADRRRAWAIALVCLVMSVIGGLFGYAIGYYLFDTIGQPLLEFYGYADKFDSFKDSYNDYGAWIVFFFGITPFPYKVITIASGVAALNPVVFLAASVASRGLRFFLVAGLLWLVGEPIREFIERRLGLVMTIFFVGLFGGFIAIKYLF